MSLLLKAQNEAAEARGAIPKGQAMAVTYAQIAERAYDKFYSAYYGNKAMAEAKKQTKDVRRTQDLCAGLVHDPLLADIAPMLGAYERAGWMADHTTSDFPLTLLNLRQRRVLPEVQGPEGGFPEWAGTPVQVSSFETIRLLDYTEAPELLLRPEDTDVQYMTVSESEQGYRVANYERAFSYTWEMFLAQNGLMMLDRVMSSAGRAASRLRRKVTYEALDAGLARSVETGVTTGQPTITNVANARVAFANRTYTDADGVTNERGTLATDILFGTQQVDIVAVTLRQQTTDGTENGPPNLNLGLEPHMDRMWNRFLGSDWVLFDDNEEWFEVATLEGFGGGAKTYTKMPDVQEHQAEGSFANHSLAFKMGDVAGAKVTRPEYAIRVEGA